MSGEVKADKQYVPIPESYSRRQLNALYREIPLKDTTSRMLRKYFNAMANLYGIIPLRKAYEIISEQSPSLVTEDEFLAFAEIARHEIEDYYILGADEVYTDGKQVPPMEREIIDILLFGDNTDLYIETKHSQQDKPYYIPPKRELLLYDDAFYCGDAPIVSEMKSFLEDRFHLTGRKAEEVFLEILYGSRYLGAGDADLMRYLDRAGKAFDSDDDLNRFIELQQSFHNSIRMQCNRGHTPDEMMAMLPPEERIPRSLSFGPNIKKAIADGSINADELRSGIMAMNVPSEELRLSLLREIEAAEAKTKPKKIGRNDPCPCGSGKKYKKCCGR